jgi:hypothetical protein
MRIEELHLKALKIAEQLDDLTPEEGRIVLANVEQFINRGVLLRYRSAKWQDYAYDVIPDVLIDIDTRAEAMSLLGIDTLDLHRLGLS